MQKNLVQLFNAVVRKVGRTNQVIDKSDLRENTLNRTQVQVLDAINDEIELTLAEHSWITTQIFDATFDTEANTSVYTLSGKDDHPVDYRYIEAIAIPSQNRELDYVVNDEWTKFDIHEAKPSIPNFYRIRRVDAEGNPLIEVHPTPKQAYTVHYSYNEAFTRLEDPNDRSPVDDQLVILGASMMLLDTDGQDFQLMSTRYSRLLEKIMDRNKPTPDDMQYGSGHTTDRHLEAPRFPEQIDV